MQHRLLPLFLLCGALLSAPAWAALALGQTAPDIALINQGLDEGLAGQPLSVTTRRPDGCPITYR